MNLEEASNLMTMCSSFDRFHKFLEIKDQLNDKDYWKILSDAYTCSDNLFHLIEDVKEAFIVDRPFREFLMDEEDFKVYNSLPEKLIIYRGMTIEELESENFGVSWTLSKKTAEFFAYTYGRNFSTVDRPKTVHQLEVSKVEIIAYFGGRNEQEVIYIY